MTRAQKLARWCGAASVFSGVFFAFTGLAFWAPIDMRSGVDFIRMMILVVIHAVGIGLGIASLDDRNWTDKP